MRYSIIKNKLMSALLAAILLLSLIPAAAYAAIDTTGTSAATDEKLVQPVTAEFSFTPPIVSKGHAAVVISEEAVADIITKAMDNMKAQGKSTNEIGVALNINLPDTANSLGVVLTQAVLKDLVDAGIKHLEVNGSILALNFDMEAVKEIQKQSTGDVTITLFPAQSLPSPAKSLSGTRPAYNITISYVNNGKTVNIIDFGNGTAIVSIPYKPGENAAPYIPGGRDGQQNGVAAPYIPGGHGGQQNYKAAPFIPGGLY